MTMYEPNTDLGLEPGQNVGNTGKYVAISAKGAFKTLPAGFLHPDPEQDYMRGCPVLTVGHERVMGDISRAQCITTIDVGLCYADSAKTHGFIFHDAIVSYMESTQTLTHVVLGIPEKRYKKMLEQAQQLHGVSIDPLSDSMPRVSNGTCWILANLASDHPVMVIGTLSNGKPLTPVSLVEFLSRLKVNLIGNIGCIVSLARDNKSRALGIHYVFDFTVHIAEIYDTTNKSVSICPLNT